jgi:hypothetical protein
MHEQPAADEQVMRHRIALVATALVGTALFSGTAGAASFDLTVVNKSHAPRSYQLVQVGQPCNSGTVLENGWIAPGETKIETFRSPNEPLIARLCVDLRPETRLRFEPGEDVRTRLVADADDPADVDVEPVPDQPEPNDYDVVGLYVINIGENAEISITPDYAASKCEAGMQSLGFNKPGEHRGSWKFRVDNSGWCALKPTVVVWHVRASGPGWKSEGAIIANNAAPFVFTSHCGLSGGLECSAAGWGPGLFGTIRIWRR